MSKIAFAVILLLVVLGMVKERRMIKRLLPLTFLFAFALPAHAGTCPASAPSGITNCYYIDYASGSDSNTGTSESSPWKHAPGMQGLNTSGGSTGDGCTANCAANAPTAGVGYILKGGTVWPYTTAPWVWTWSGSSSGATFGCTGAGCIYVGYDPAWNQGEVNSVTLTRDLGGCNPSSTPTVFFSGGGGSGAAATAEVTPAAAGAQEPNVAGDIYHIVVTNQGSGYTSNPTVTIGGSGCTGATAVADIQRPVLDYGSGSGVTWPVGNGAGNLTAYGPGITAVNANYLIFDHLELRNILQIARCVSGVPCGISTAFLNIASGTTVEYCYIHGRFTNNVTNADYAQEQDDSAISIGGPTDEIYGNTMENGDAAFFENSSSGDNCGSTVSPPNLLPCTFTEHDAKIVPGTPGSGEMQHNYLYSVRWGTHWGGNSSMTLPALIHDNEIWNILYDVGGAHINEMYLEYTLGNIYVYNNVLHSAVNGASNQQQLGNGTTQYFFNNVSWALGGGTSNYGLDADGMAGATDSVYFYNNTMYGEGGTRDCLDDNASTYASTLFVVLQNNHCITSANPYYIKSSGSTYSNQSGNTTQATIEASSTVDTSSAAAGEGYTVSTLYAPTASTNDTVAFAGSANSANLTSLCTGYLVPLCSDINGNPRPSSGGWQAGAYFYGGASSSSQSSQNSLAPPTGLTAVVH